MGLYGLIENSEMDICINLVYTMIISTKYRLLNTFLRLLRSGVFFSEPKSNGMLKFDVLQNKHNQYIIIYEYNNKQLMAQFRFHRTEMI